MVASRDMSDSVCVSRRALLGGALAGAAAVGLPSGRSGAAERRAGTAGRPASKRPGPGLLPNPKAPAGTDQLPQITTIVAVMMENHTYDSLLGTLAKGDGERARAAPLNRCLRP